MTPTIKMRIEELEDRIQFYNVPVPYDGGELHDISWSKKLLNGGAELTQDEHIRRTRDTEFKVPSGLVYGATILASYDISERTGEEKALFDALKRFTLSPLPIFTSTRIRYTPRGLDQVIHDYPNAQTRALNLVGPNRHFQNEDADVLEALFGTRNCSKFKVAVECLIGGYLPYLYLCRVTAKPQQDVEHVLAFSCSIYDLLVVITNPYNCLSSLPARGVVVTPSSSRQKNQGEEQKK